MHQEEHEKSNYVLWVIMILVVGAIVYFMGFSAGQSKKDSSAGGNTKDSSTIEYSVDNEDEPYRTLSYTEAAEKMEATDGKQMFYVGCRDCGHCQNLESVMKEFLAKQADKNQNRDLIYKVEAGYSCVPSDETGAANYIKLFDTMVKIGAVEDEPSKQFGTPQFFYVENGKVVDDLNNYGRSVDGISQLFTAHNYRGF